MNRFLKWTLRIFGVIILIGGLVVTWNWDRLQRLLKVNSLFAAENIVTNFSGMNKMFFNREMEVKSATPHPLPLAPMAMPETLSFRGTTISFEDWQKERDQTAMVVLKDGKIAYEAYFKDTTPEDRRISWSMAKSYLSAAFGVAVRDGHIPDLNAQVTDYVPELAETAYKDATIRNVLNMASGVKFNEDYLDFNSDINRMGRVLALGNSMDGFAASLSEQAREAGSKRQYVSIDTHVLGMVLRAATGRDVPDYLSETILKPLNMEADAYYLTDGYGTAFVLGGLNLRTRDYARFGLMFAQGGRLGDTQIVPADWVEQSTSQSAPPPYEDDEGTDNGLLGYGYQWWLPPDAKAGEFFAIGVYGQYIYVDSARNVVIAVNGADRNFRDDDGRITVMNLEHFRQIARHLDGS